jgi:hypothetical protein
MPAVAAMAADLGGDVAGNAFQQLHSMQTGSHSYTRQQLETLQSLGLVDPSKVRRIEGSNRIQVGIGALEGSLAYADDEAGWVRDVLWPAVTRASGGDAAKAEALIDHIFPNSNAGRAAHMLGDAGFLAQQAKDAGLAGLVGSPESGYEAFKNENPKAVKEAFEKQFGSMMAAIGSPLMKGAMPVMQAVTGIFTTIGQVANKHPRAVKYVGEGLAGLAIGLTGLGAAAVITAAVALAPGGAIVGAVTSVAAILGTIAAINWDSVKSNLGWLVDKVKGLADLFSAGGAGAKSPLGGTIPSAHDLIQKQNYNPGVPPRGDGQPLHVHLHIDGQDVAQVVTKIQMAQARFPSQAPYHDSYASYSPPDVNLQWG